MNLLFYVEKLDTIDQNFTIDRFAEGGGGNASIKQSWIDCWNVFGDEVKEDIHASISVINLLQVIDNFNNYVSFRFMLLLM